MYGLFNLAKPAGMSSREAIDYLQRLVRPAKAGHAGTLDPIAIGVLVACVGPATRLIEFVQQMPKRYRAWFRLGCWSPSDDIETEVTRLDLAPKPSVEQLQEVLPHFTGLIQQRPPAFSAIKVDGRRAYKLARKGKPLELAPRPVTIYRLQVLEYAYPEMLLDIECSSGTYVRSLGRDLAEALGTRCVMTALERSAVGPFGLADAIDPTTLTRENVESYRLPARSAVPDLPTIVLTDEEKSLIANGRHIPRRVEGEKIAAFNAEGELLAILTPREENRLGPLMNLVSG